MVNYAPPTYEGYKYPSFARGIGVTLSVIPIIPVPVFMATQIANSQGSFLQVGIRVPVLIETQIANSQGPFLQVSVLVPVFMAT